MKKYNRLDGVPPGSYYLIEVTQFEDFEVSRKERILFVSTDKQELIDLCIKNNWPCPDANNADSWHTHFIRNRKASSI